MPSVLVNPMNGVEPGRVNVKMPTSRPGFLNNGSAASTSILSGVVPADKKVTPGPIKKPSPSGGGFTPRYDATVVGSSNALLSKTGKVNAAKRDKNTNVAVWSLN